MKTLKFILLAAIALFCMTSCQKDEIHNLDSVGLKENRTYTMDLTCGFEWSSDIWSNELGFDWSDGSDSTMHHICGATAPSLTVFLDNDWNMYFQDGNVTIENGINSYESDYSVDGQKLHIHYPEIHLKSSATGHYQGSRNLSFTRYKSTDLSDFVFFLILDW
jgi:hypothetical protein